MKTEEIAAEDLEAGQKFVSAEGELCVITVVSFDDDAYYYSYAGCECCGVEEYYWIYFTRPDGETDQYRLWKFEELNVVVSE